MYRYIIVINLNNKWNVKNIHLHKTETRNINTEKIEIEEF